MDAGCHFMPDLLDSMLLLWTETLIMEVGRGELIRPTFLGEAPR